MTNFKEDLIRVKAFVFDIDGVLSLQTISLNGRGIPRRTVNLRDGYAIQLAVRKGYRVGIISGSNAKDYIKRLKSLGVTDVYLNSRVKTEHFNDFCSKYDIKPSDVMFMGDDIPDYEVMQRCGFAACPADAAQDIRAIAHYVSTAVGGKGAVREVLEHVLRAQDKWMDADAFVW